jgi:hypothetical protein
MKIPKALMTNDLTVIYALLGSTHVKASRKMLMKLTPGVSFINVLHTAFEFIDPKSVKITVMSSMSFYTFGN